MYTINLCVVVAHLNLGIIYTATGKKIEAEKVPTFICIIIRISLSKHYIIVEHDCGL